MTAQRGVVYLGRIPHGFYEEEIKAYFAQFGEVTRVRVSRNPRTGAARHYAYVEFAAAEIAPIVAETMNNYLLFGRLLKCHAVDAATLHPDTFKNSNRPFRNPGRAVKVSRSHKNRARIGGEWVKTAKGLAKRDAARSSKISEVLAQHGISFKFPAATQSGEFSSAASPLTDSASAVTAAPVTAKPTVDGKASVKTSVKAKPKAATKPKAETKPKAAGKTEVKAKVEAKAKGAAPKKARSNIKLKSLKKRA